MPPQIVHILCFFW